MLFSCRKYVILERPSWKLPSALSKNCVSIYFCINICFCIKQANKIFTLLMFDELAEKVSDGSLGRDETYVCKASHIIIYCRIPTLFFKLLIGRLCNWESLCDIRPDCHHHFDASGTSNAMFDELAERSLMGLLAGMKHTYVRLAI